MIHVIQDNTTNRHHYTYMHSKTLKVHVRMIIIKYRILLAERQEKNEIVETREDLNCFCSFFF